jgi:hypothetical protein
MRKLSFDRLLIKVLYRSYLIYSVARNLLPP